MSEGRPLRVDTFQSPPKLDTTIRPGARYAVLGHLMCCCVVSPGATTTLSGMLPRFLQKKDPHIPWSKTLDGLGHHASCDERPQGPMRYTPPDRDCSPASHEVAQKCDITAAKPGRTTTMVYKEGRRNNACAKA